MICYIAVLLLLAGYVYYVVRLFCIAFFQVRRDSSKPSRVRLSLTYVMTDDREDGAYDLLWHTQLPALELLKAAGSGGVPAAQMTQLYHDFARANPELCDGASFSDWLEALQDSEVAVRQGDRIAITEKGLFVLENHEQTHPVN